ncbi:MAG: hypothetical protein ACYSYV_05240 [Planctomycetota bacterium]|jgi:hypothetical protein
MKTSMLTITAFVALNLAMASSTLAEFASADAEPPPGLPPGPAASSDFSVGDSFAVENRLPWATTRLCNGAVLVIPSTQMKSQDLLAIMEDMNVMARIFDKQLTKNHLIRGRDYNLFYSRRSNSELNWRPLDSLLGKQQGQATETIYLEGFGAIFLMGVDFPLVPPPEVQEKKTEEPTDRIWAETKQEIYMPDAARKSREAPQAEEYDAEKVEKIKRTLTTALKHASNIRALKPDEWAILTVIGQSGRPGGAIGHAGQDCRACHALTEKVDYKSSPSQMGSCLPTALTICAKKSDIDSFSEGKLDFDQFQERTKIFTSYAKLGSGGLPDVEDWQAVQFQPSAKL